MSLECMVCRNNYKVLKQLSCRHVFCGRCLREIERFGKIKCPYCRRETQLDGSKIEDLGTQFGCQLQCCDCQRPGVEVKDSLWCKECSSILCRKCSDQSHHEHDGLESTARLGPVKFCVQELDRYSAIHTRLTMLQKQLVREYMQQLGDALERELDHDLTQRLLRFKAEKQNLRSSFDLEARSDDVVGSGNITGNGRCRKATTARVAALKSASALGSSSDEGTSSGDETKNARAEENKDLSPADLHFVQVLYELTKMSENLTPTRQLAALPKDGQIFNPLPVDKTVELFLQQGRFSTFGTSMNAISKQKQNQVPAEYWAAGSLDDPFDLCAVPDYRLLVVSCLRKGLFVFSLDDGNLLNHYPLIHENDQLNGVTYDSQNRYIVTTVLRNFREWFIQIFEISTMRLRDEIPCPDDEETQVKNSWYRWVTSISASRVIFSTGDRIRSCLWMLHLHSRRWTNLHTRPNSAFRKVAFHQPKSKNYTEGLLYVPDMHNKSIVTFVMNRATCELSKEDEISTPELQRGLPNCVLAAGGTLFVGHWNTGNLIMADLEKCNSKKLTCVGPNELFNLCYLQDERKLLVLCKKKELIEVYSL